MKAEVLFCGKCGAVLTDANWFASFRKGNTGICKGCANKNRHAMFCITCGSALEDGRCTACQAKKQCVKCGELLTDENWYAAFKKRNVGRCKDCHNQLAASWGERHPEDAAKRVARWKVRHPEYGPNYYISNKATIAHHARRRLWKVKTAALTKLGGQCVVCGITDMRILQINHLNGGGGQENLYGHEMYQAIIAGTRPTEDLDVRCANHNLIYEYERGMRKQPADLDTL